MEVLNQSEKKNPVNFHRGHIKIRVHPGKTINIEMKMHKIAWKAEYKKKSLGHRASWILVVKTFIFIVKT